MSNKTAKRFVASAALTAAVVTCGVLSNKITKYLVSMALDREMPKVNMKRKISGSSDIRESDENFKLLKSKLENSCKEVIIKSGDGKRLVGHWLRCETPKRIILAMHGWRSSWANDFALIAPFWQENNCDVLFVEQRGQNNSDGGYMSFGLVERFDCYDWINWVNATESDKLPIFLAGISMGATTVLMAGGFKLPENVKGIIADCGFTSPVAIWKHVVEKNLRLNYKLRKATINKLCKKKLKLNVEEYSAIDAMKNCEIPVLFIHGANDKFVPVEMTYENYYACQARKKLFIVPGADHGMSYYVDKEGYEREFKSFLDECEKGGGVEVIGNSEE